MTHSNESLQNSDVTDEKIISADDGISVEQWLALRKEAGKKIDPNTAEVFSCKGEIANPYGAYPTIPEYSCVGRLYFARSPGSDLCVSFHDLPDETRKAIWKKIDAGRLNRR